MTGRIERILRSTEKFTRTDMVYLASGGFWLGTAQVGIGLASFAVSLAFAWLVPKEAYGTYQFLLAAFWSIAAFSMGGISDAVARAVARGAEGAYREAFRPFILGSLPILVIGAGAAVYYHAVGNDALALGMLVIGVVGTFLRPSYLFAAFLEGKRAFRTNALFGIILNAVPAALLIATMFVSHDPVVFLSVYLVANVAAGAVLCFAAYLIYKPNRARDPELVSLGFHFSANGILGTFAAQADQLALFHFLGPASVAVYSFATAFPDQAKNLVNAVATVAFPKFAAKSREEVARTLPYRLALMTLALVLMAGIYWLLAPFLFHIFLPAYAEAVPYSQYYALALIPLASAIPLTAIQAQADKRALYIISTVGPIVQIGLLVALIALYGLIGAIAARILGRAFSLFLGLFFMRPRKAGAVAL